MVSTTLLIRRKKACHRFRALTRMQTSKLKLIGALEQQSGRGEEKARSRCNESAGFCYLYVCERSTVAQRLRNDNIRGRAGW